MDCDLQDPPSEISRFLKEIKEGLPSVGSPPPEQAISLKASSVQVVATMPYKAKAATSSGAGATMDPASESQRHFWITDNKINDRVIEVRLPAPHVITALSRAGAQDGTGVFALAKILDAARLWRAIGPHHDGVQFTGGDDAIGVRGPSGTVWLEQSDALELLFGRGPRAVPRLPRAERRLLGRCLPWPLYVWGFDSI